MGMVKPLRDGNGKFQGSINLGGKDVPKVESVPHTPSPLRSQEPPRASSDASWGIFQKKMNDILNVEETFPCGCLTNSGCPAPLGEDCMRDPFFVWNERKIWHKDICEAEESVRFVSSDGHVWFVREYHDAGKVVYAAQGRPDLVGEVDGTLEDALTLLDENESHI